MQTTILQKLTRWTNLQEALTCPKAALDDEEGDAKVRAAEAAEVSICGARPQVGGKLCAPANALRHVLVEVAQQPRLLIHSACT